MDFQAKYQQKLTTADEAVKVVKSGDWVDYGFCVGTPVALDAALARRAEELIDINAAGAEELMTLNGIGEMRAAAIIKFREQNGPFVSIEEIMLIPGIKEGIFFNFQDQIVVR